MSVKRILMLLGGIYHDFAGFERAHTPLLQTAGHEVEPTYDLAALLTLHRGAYDLVLSYTSLSRRTDEPGDAERPDGLSPEQTAALVTWVHGGGAYLPLHSATVSGRPNPHLRALAGAAFEEHPPRFTFLVQPLHRRHPITLDVPAFAVYDELYIQDCTEDIAVHMVACDRGVCHPMVWSRLQGQGRVAHIAMGHGPEAWSLEPYQRLVLQAVDWLTA